MPSVEEINTAVINALRLIAQLSKAAEVLSESISKAPAMPAPMVAPPVNQAPAPLPVPTEPVVNAVEVAPVAVPAQVVPPPPAAPKPAAPKPAAVPPRPPAAPKPVAKPATPAPVIPNRQPAREENDHESITELAEVADRVARDKDPQPTVTPVNTVQTIASVPASTAVVVLPPAPVAAAPVDGLPTREELASFKNRAGKILYDKLVKDGGMKQADASPAIKNFIIKEGGAPAMEKITKAKWEEILTTLENASPVVAAAIVKGA
jgi:hypothetical protein